MSGIAFITDSNSGITQEEAAKYGVYVLPMPFMINEQTYYEGTTISPEEFYQKQVDGAKITTSQPTPDEVTSLWDKVLKEYDEIVYVPMSSGLSSSCQTAKLLALDYDGRVQVADNQRISVTQLRSILDAKLLYEEKGMDAAEIKEFLEKDKFNSSIYIMLDTLTYLKRGGR
ncbi:MAG: DegV family protein, partial [Lachnospiraceae bacterium]|nr:DegV family protein [Lachnospiraceae bacterium]